MNRRIFVTFKVEGIHKYPEALTNPDLEDVSFLGYPHRHIFHFRVEVSVNHTDRDIEFIQLKRWLSSLFKDDVLDADYKSCEMLCDDLKDQILEKYLYLTHLKIEISEDGENGAILELNERDLYDEYNS